MAKKEVYLHKHIEKNMEKSNIPLWIDSYDDIFSDFDPRHYDNRALSDDFLQEVKRASRDKDGDGIELRFLVPKKNRNLHIESVIKKRLHEHFNKHFHQLKDEVNGIVHRGIIFTVAGIFTMILATILMFYYSHANIFISFFIILFEPGGWFLFWEGLGQIIFEPKTKKHEVEFYHKMSRSEIYFMTY